MKFKCEPGIYLINNTSTKKIYVGSSVNISVRITAHKGLLKNNKHNNIYLQRAYNKYGKNSFIFEILEYCDEKLLLVKEAFYIQKFNSNNPNYGYNIESFERGRKRHNQISKDKIGNALRGRKRIITEEWKKNMCIGQANKKLSKIHKRNIGLSKIGKKRKINETWKNKMTEGRRKYLFSAYLNNKLIYNKKKISELSSILNVCNRSIYSAINDNYFCKGFKLKRCKIKH